MEPEVMIGAFSLAGSALGTLAGIVTSSKLTNYRIKQLEKKVDKHNQLVERMVVVEQSVKSAHHRIDDLRKGIKKDDTA